MDAWKIEEPQITTLIKNLYRTCPSLFDTLLSKSDQDSLRSLLVEHDNENDKIVLQPNTRHKNITATGRLRTKYCKEVLKVLLCASDPLTTTDFKSQLRNAFAQDYNMQNVMYFGPYGFQ